MGDEGQPLSAGGRVPIVVFDTSDCWSLVGQPKISCRDPPFRTPPGSTLWCAPQGIRGAFQRAASRTAPRSLRGEV